MHNSLANWDDTTTIDFHRFQAVKSVNERLNLEGKNNDSPVSDGLIVAVALLVNTEVRGPLSWFQQGSLVKIETHTLLGIHRFLSRCRRPHEWVEADGRIKGRAPRRLRLQQFAPADHGLVSPPFLIWT